MWLVLATEFTFVFNKTKHWRETTTKFPETKANTSNERLSYRNASGKIISHFVSAVVICHEIEKLEIRQQYEVGNQYQIKKQQDRQFESGSR